MKKIELRIRENNGCIKDINSLADFIKSYYDYKVEIKSSNDDSQYIIVVLYEIYFIKCILDVEKNEFDAFVFYGDDRYKIVNLLGKTCKTKNEYEKIENSLMILDDYCIARLPSKYITEFEKVYKKI